MEKLAALTGAGISRPSGIPTFMEMGDLREKLSRDYFLSHPQEFFDVLQEMKGKIDTAEPNPAHLALARYDVPLVTMNIDGLHSKAGSTRVIEIHGNLEFVYCKNCKTKYDYSVLQNSIYCSSCSSLLEPNVVLYGDSIPYYFNAIDMIGSAERLLVVGTSFYTSTAGDLVGMAQRAGIPVEIINRNAETEVPRFLNEIFHKK